MVGCGNGDEVVYFRRSLGSPRTFGLDIERNFSVRARAEKCVLIGEGEALPFPSACFDFAAAFHSLEHVRDPRAVLAEVYRVLRPGGWFYIGVPNKSRLVGYLGSFGATPWQKLAFNLRDYYHRLHGRFENRLGAHAGYRAGELLALLGERFSSVDLLTEEYLRFKYGGRRPRFLLDLLLAPRVINYTAAAHYALCRKDS
jgi:ubiquinone/menaquinone biosynthesis C-methylase UbiE